MLHCLLAEEADTTCSQRTPGALEGCKHVCAALQSAPAQSQGRLSGCAAAAQSHGLGGWAWTSVSKRLLPAP